MAMAVWLAVCAAAEIPAEDGDPIVYKIANGHELKLHVYKHYKAKPGDKRIGIVFFNGGAWQRGWWAQFSFHANYLSRHGYVCICAEYRVYETHGTTPFDAVEDAKDAMRFVRENSYDLGIDPSKILAAGSSAGGHLAACTELVGDPGINSCRPNGLILYNAVLSCDPIGGFGGDYIGEDWPGISPLHLVREGMPKTLIINGDADRTTTAEVARKFYDEMKWFGNFAMLYIYSGQKHGFSNYRVDEWPWGHNPLYYRVMQEVLVFLRRFE
jgi:acetyl esterase/lipase